MLEIAADLIARVIGRGVSYSKAVRLAQLVSLTSEVTMYALAKILATVVFFVPLFAVAQTNDVIPDSAKTALADDLQQLQQSIVAAQNQSVATVPEQFNVAKFSDSLVDITRSSAPVKAGASRFAKTLASAEQGEQFKVLDKAGDWYAVQLKTPKDNIKTGWINAAYLTPSNQVASGATSVVPSGNPAKSESTFEVIVRKASEMKDKYKDNPYFTVSGFTVNVGLSPSVSMQFLFKK